MQQLHRPSSLVMDELGLILVADYDNSRVHMLTPDLQLVRHLLNGEYNIGCPRQLCLDAERGLLFVGCEDGSIKSFKVRD